MCYGSGSDGSISSDTVIGLLSSNGRSWEHLDPRELYLFVWLSVLFLVFNFSSKILLLAFLLC